MKVPRVGVMCAMTAVLCSGTSWNRGSLFVLGWLCGGMLAHRVKYAAQIDKAFPIQLQSFDCGASSRCQTDDEGKVVIPGEMVTPPLLPGMIQ
jgi:hypothetical protein